MSRGGGVGGGRGEWVSHGVGEAAAPGCGTGAAPAPAPRAPPRLSASPPRTYVRALRGARVDRDDHPPLEQEAQRGGPVVGLDQLHHLALKRVQLRRRRGGGDRGVITREWGGHRRSLAPRCPCRPPPPTPIPTLATAGRGKRSTAPPSIAAAASSGTASFAAARVTAGPSIDRSSFIGAPPSAALPGTLLGAGPITAAAGWGRGAGAALQASWEVLLVVLGREERQAAEGGSRGGHVAAVGEGVARTAPPPAPANYSNHLTGWAGCWRHSREGKRTGKPGGS